MPREPKIFFAEDNRIVRREVLAFLSQNGFKVVAEAASFAEAEEKVELAVREGANVAILDGDLGTGRTDGMRLAKLLREKIPGIRIIPFSFLPVDWGDVKTTKGDSLDLIAKAIGK